MIGRFDQVLHAGKHTAAQSLVSDVAEEALDHVQPRRRSGREVHVESPVLVQPLLHHGVLVRGVVVADQVQRLVFGRLTVDLPEELQPLGMAMARLALRDDLPVEYVQCSEQCSRAVALVVMRHGRRAPLLQCQPGLGAIECLHLTLLVAAQHQRVFGRRHIQAHDVFELLDELRIARDLEAAYQVRLQAISTPVTRHARCADAQLRAHRARAPVRGRFGLGLRGQLHQTRNVHTHRWRPTHGKFHRNRLNCQKVPYGLDVATCRLGPQPTS